LLDGEWIELQTAAGPEGSPSYDDVETIGFEFIMSNGVSTPNLSAPYLAVDYLQGADATNPNYSGSPGDALDNMSAIVRHFIADHCGEGHGAIGDSLKKYTSATSGWSQLNMTAETYGGVVTAYGYTFTDILNGLAFEGRGNIIAEEASSGTVYEYHTAFGSGGVWLQTLYYSSRTIDEWINLREATRPTSEVATRMRAYWGYDPFLGDGIEAFTKTSRADPDGNDTSLATATISAAETAIGRRAANPLMLLLVDDETTAEKILEYYINEAIRYERNVWEMEVPHWLAYDLQRADEVKFTPTWASERKTRVVGITGSFLSPARRLTLVEVN
jgi:hypothetical protein